MNQMVLRVLSFLFLLHFSLATAQEKVYVTNTNGTVAVIDTASNTVLTTINVATSPVVILGGIVTHPNNTKVYIVGSNFNSIGNVYVIDTANDTLSTTIPISTTSGNPLNLAISPDGSKLYVTSGNAFRINIIDTATNTVEGTSITTGGTTRGIAITPNGATAFVGNVGANRYETVTISNNTVTQRATANPTNAVAISPDGTQVYIASNNFNSSLFLINAVDYTTLHPPISITATTRGIAFLPNGTYAYVTHSTLVTKINTSSYSTADISMGASTMGIAITPDGSRAYIVSGTQVEVLNTDSDSVTGSIPIGGTPQYVTIATPSSTPTPSPNTTSSPRARLIEANYLYSPLRSL